MSKPDLSISEDRLTRTASPISWVAAFYFTAFAGLVALIWVNTGWAASQILGIPFFSALYAIQVYTAQKGLACTPVQRAWSYRLAFLAGVVLASARWLSLAVQPGQRLSPLWLAPALGGALLGALFVTGLNEGLWEDNHPPSKRIQAEVRQRHLERNGEPGRAPFWKRAFDVGLALLGLALSLPVWLACLLLVWFEDPGPVLFVKNSVGRGGDNFRQFKFRTMIRLAEHGTGPVLASERDTRMLRIGYFLRKTALDELPQLINILKGEMSFVGPRPQRTVLVHGYLEIIPEYAERHRVLPGLAGLAQVAGSYYLTPRQKLRYDRLYIRHASPGFDLKLICLAFLVTFWYRWRNGWNGRLPRGLLRVGGGGKVNG